MHPVPAPLSGPARPPASCRLVLEGEASTRALAARLAPCLAGGDTLLLEGEIGAGKTAFARALIQARQCAEGRAPEDVPSPTYTLVQVYDAGALTIWHADLYRLSAPDEALELGLDEATGTALCLIEWPDRLGALVPAGALHLSFTPGAAEESRILTLWGGDTGLWARIAPALACGAPNPINPEPDQPQG